MRFYEILDVRMVESDRWEEYRIVVRDTVSGERDCIFISGSDDFLRLAWIAVPGDRLMSRDFTKKGKKKRREYYLATGDGTYSVCDGKLKFVKKDEKNSGGRLWS